MLLRTLELGPFLSNCYLVGSEETKEGIVIDAGAEGEEILQNIEEMGLKIKFIVATHGHNDHVLAVKAVKEATGAEFAIHKDDQPTLSQGEGYFSFPAPPPPDILLQGGDKLELGPLSFLILHTPGHSPGGICLLGQGVVFSGDTLFFQGIGRTDFPGGNHRLLIKSIHTKLLILPDPTPVYPGHGPQTTIGNERRWNPFLR